MKPLRSFLTGTALFFSFSLVLSLSNPLLAPATSVGNKLQPYLVQVAADSPDEMVNVIVQKADSSNHAEKFAQKLGAKIYAELDIISSFAAVIRADRIPELAEHASVQWVSYDAPMINSGESAPRSSEAGDQQDWLCEMFQIGCEEDPQSAPPDSDPAPTDSVATDPVAEELSEESDCWWDTSFSRRSKITFNNSASEGNLHNFPTLIKLNARNADYSKIQDQGQDIRFIDGNSCARLLGYEIEQWDETGDSYVWVNVPRIDAESTDDYIYMYYDNPSATDAQNPAAVWSETYAAVYHLNGDAKDSSGNNHHGTFEGSCSPSVTDGMIADALHFGDCGWINTHYAESYGDDGWSMEVFWKASGFGQKKYILSSSKAEDEFVAIGVDGVSHFVEANRTDDGTVEDTNDVWVPISEIDTNQWHYTVFQRPNADVRARAPLTMYLDGFEVLPSEAMAGYFNLNSPYSIGHRNGFGNEYNFSGEIDEVRISYRGIVRTEDYFEAQQLSMRDAFLSIAEEEVYDGSQPLLEPTPVEVPPDPTPAPRDSAPDESPPSENTYLETLYALRSTGSGNVIVAVVDSGVQYDNDFKGDDWNPDRIVAHISGVQGEEGFYMSPNNDTCSNWEMGSCWYVTDQYGHGTHVAGIIAGNGADSGGLYRGIAPKTEVVNFRVADQYGVAHESGIVEAMQYILELKKVYGYNIRVLNISINSSVEQSYHDSPLNAALEILWFNGIVVVASAGNSGGLDYNTINAAPANDPYVITVGATDEHGTADRSDDTIPTWSAHGVTMDGVVKPDVYAPGRNIISVLSSQSAWASQYPHRVYGEGEYFRMSGTSMAAPMVAGVIAHLLYINPGLRPDQVKHLVMHGVPILSSNGQSGAYLDAAELGDEASDWGLENQDNVPHILLAKMAMVAYWADDECGDTCDWENIDWESVNWNSVDWNSVDWDSVNWNSIDWDSVNWNSVDWGSVNWNSVNWNSVNWNSVDWDSVNWNSIDWDSVNWNSVNWNSVNWNSTFWGN
jgi:subtilisin family serine protease